LTAIFYGKTLFVREQLYSPSTLAWAVENSVAPEVMAFIQVRPDLLIGSAEMLRADHAIMPSPRSWERVSEVWKNCIGKREREILICGLVGDSTAHEFLTVADELTSWPGPTCGRFRG
jgi:hypothetical protein